MSENDGENTQKIEIQLKDEDKIKKLEQELKESQEKESDYREKLELVAIKEAERLKKAVTEKAKAIFKDPERVKEIESKMDVEHPETIKNTEYLVDTLQKELETMEKSRKEAQKSTPAGSPLTPAQYGQQQEQNLRTRKFASINDAIMECQRLKKEGTSAQAEEAEAILKQLWIKAMHDYRAGGHPSSVMSEDENVPKTTNEPTIQLSEPATPQNYSELERYGIKTKAVGDKKVRQMKEEGIQNK